MHYGDVMVLRGRECNAPNIRAEIIEGVDSIPGRGVERWILFNLDEGLNISFNSHLSLIGELNNGYRELNKSWDCLKA